MHKLIVCLLATGLIAAAPALAAERHNSGGSHPTVAHRASGTHLRRPASHHVSHRPAGHRTTHRAMHRGRHTSRAHVRHVTHRAVHHAARHAVQHAVRHAAHAAVNRADRFAKVRRSVRAMRRFHAGTYRRPAGWYAHHWVIGERLPRAWFAREYWISDWAIYGLWAPIDGLIWVRVGPDAVLLDPSGGLVVGIEYGLFF